MKKYIISIVIALVTVAMLPLETFAAGGFSVSTSHISLYSGESSTFSISASNAAGRINISSSNSGVASLSAGSVFLDLDSQNVTVTANSVGNATIYIVASSDFSTYDEENLGGQSRAISVSVIERAQPQNQAPTQSNTTSNSNSSSSSTTQSRNSSQSTSQQTNIANDQSNENSIEEPAKSSNTKLASISIEGYEVTQSGDDYQSTIPHDVSKVNIVATVEDAKSTISGATGEVKLGNGENSFEIIVTAEDGTTKTYQLKIYREPACGQCSASQDCQQSPIFIILTIVEGLALLAIAAYFIAKKVKQAKQIKQAQKAN